MVGLAEAAILTTSNALIGDYFEAPGRQRWLAMQSIVGPIVAWFYVLAGGYLGEWSWRGPFLLYLFGLAFAFYPLTRWCKENEGFSWPWPRVESEKKRIKKLRRQQEAEKAADEYKELLEKVKTSLGDKVKDVRVTYRLTDSPSCLVSDEHDPSGNLARMMKAAGQPMPATKPILEINPQHPAVMRLKYEESRFDDWAALLFEQATLAEGGQLLRERRQLLPLPPRHD